jgi:hypothetical protein
MIRRLPVLYKTENNIYEEIELKKPSGALLADVQDTVQKNWPLAMRNFVAGCTISIISPANTIEDNIGIKAALGKMSNKNIEYLSQEIMVDYYKGDDYVEGVYPCPRCGTHVIAEKKSDDGIDIDTRDRISDLKVNFMNDISEYFFELELEEPVELDENEEPIKNITVGFPTVENYIEVFNLMGDRNRAKFQFAVYARAIQKVNNQEVSNSWKKSKGVLLFNKSENTINDIGKITEYFNKYGVDPCLEKTCRECGKVWQPLINTSNFFGSALL